MPDYLPIRPRGESSPNAGRASRIQRRAELQLLEYGLSASLRAAQDQIDTQCLGDALATAMREEVGLLNYGLQLADGSAAKAAIVANKVALFTAIDERRIARRFNP